MEPLWYEHQSFRCDNLLFFNQLINYFAKFWLSLGDGLFEIICKVLKVNRIARKNRIKNDTLRSSNIMLLWGNDGWVSHTDNKVK